MNLPAQGGCHCGALRYQIDAEPIDSGYCHCTDCRKTTGAPTLAWATVPTDAFRFLKGTPKIYRSSSTGERLFCGDCGAQILFREAPEPIYVDINIATLDAPETITPDYHIFFAHRIPWFDTQDNLPRFAAREPTA